MAATDSTQHRAAGRAKTAGARAGYLFLHSAVDGFSRLAYSEHLFDETAATAVGFWARARVWFAATGITTIPRVATDNGSVYRSATFARAVFHSGRHQRTRPFSPSAQREGGEIPADPRRRPALHRLNGVTNVTRS